jgi:peptidoglycan/xylan/chitin deacetylase (PgdA/CDA1 family)
MATGALRALADARPARDRWVALMYHELGAPGRALAEADPGYAVYCVGRDAFEAQMDALRTGGLCGASLGEARARGDARVVALTFDDGCETDWLEAAPLLRERGFGATFFVVAGFLGRRGYLTASQLRELAGAGFEIGSHSLTHRMLATLPSGEMEAELVVSREKLEDAAGVTVAHFSCPHGRWSPALAVAAARAGYRTVSTSQVGLNTPTTPATALRRVAVRRGTEPGALAALAGGRGLWRSILRDAGLDAGKRLLGEGGYAAARKGAMRLLRRGSPD